jgi:hypothetical protein
VDPYAVLALLGFLVFLFYIIYSFLNNSGNGRRSLEEDLLPTETVTAALVPPPPPSAGGRGVTGNTSTPANWRGDAPSSRQQRSEIYPAEVPKRSLKGLIKVRVVYLQTF